MVKRVLKEIVKRLWDRVIRYHEVVLLLVILVFVIMLDLHIYGDLPNVVLVNFLDVMDWLIVNGYERLKESYYWIRRIL